MPPPQRKSGKGPLIAVAVGGGLVAVVLVAVAVVVILASGGMTPQEKLRAAASDLKTDAAVGLEGDFGGGANSIRGGLTVTAGGRAYGTVTWNDSKVTVLIAEGKLFAKAGPAFWKQRISGSETPYFLKDGEQWGRLNADEFNLRFKQELSPSALAETLNEAAGGSIEPVETSWKGTKAIKVENFSSTLYISDSDDPELLHYEATTPRVALDVDPKSSSQSETLIATMRTSMGELKDSFNASARPTIADWKDTECKTSGCPVQAEIRPPYGVEPPVTIDIRFRLTADKLKGKDIGNCATQITFKSEKPVVAKCKVDDSKWKKWAGQTRSGTFYKHADYKVIGVTESEITAMQKGLDSES